MKKLLLFAAVATLFAACSKDTTKDLALSRPFDRFQVAIADEDFSRVQLDRGKTVWTSGDRVSVFNMTTGNECWQFDGYTGDTVGELTKVSGTAGEPTDKVVAVYPYNAANTISSDGVRTTIPATQTFSDFSFGEGGNIMVATSRDANLSFKHIFGWLCFQFTGDYTIKSITLRGRNGEPLAGGATIGNDLSITLDKDAATAVTLDCGDGVALSEFPTSFYVALLPQVFDKGIDIEVKTDGESYTKSIEHSVAITRNHIVPVKNSDRQVATVISYTTSDGKSIRVNTDQLDAAIVSHTYNFFTDTWKIVFDAPLTSIGNSAFAYSRNMTSMTLPEGVKSIGEAAFAGCWGLTSITLPDSITSIADYAFTDCTSLQSITLPQGIESVNPFTFNNCTALAKFYGKFASADNCCLVANGSLARFAPAGPAEYTTPEGVTSIATHAFDSCSNLTKITISEGVTSIDTIAFVDCSALRTVTLPSTLTKLGNYAFSKCSSIEGFYGNELFHTSDHRCLIRDVGSGRGIWVSTFAGYGLTEYTIPDGINGIDNYAFRDQTALTSVTIPASVISVEASAFEGCTNLATVYGPNTSDDHRAMVFDNAFGPIVARKNMPTKYHIPDNITRIKYGTFQEDSAIEEVTMGDQVTTIEGYAFAWCPSLKSVTLSAGLQDLSGYNLFYGSSNLESVYCRALLPPSYTDFQMSDFPKLKIYVPAQSLNLYQHNAGWSAYKAFLTGYKYTDLKDADFYISTDFSQDGTTGTLQTATKGKGINIVLMGDAYSDRKIADGTYKADMEYMYNNLFTEEPYKSFKDCFNVYYVNVVSATDGYEHGGSAFGGYFAGGTEVGGNDNAVFDYALDILSEADMDEAMLIVAMNSDAYAGTCYMYHPENYNDYGSGTSVSYFPKESNEQAFAQVLHHEACGHGFAKLADEYSYENMGAVPDDEISSTQSQQNSWGWWKNVDFTSNPSAVRWSYFLSDARYANDGLGVFEGGLTYWTGVWRPTDNSIMRHNTDGFNAPSREAIYYRIHKLAYGASWEYDYEEFATWDAINRKSASQAPKAIYRPQTYAPTHAPIVVGRSWRDAR